MSEFEELNTEGFFFAAHSIRGSVMHAYYGDGYGEGAVVGSPAGLKTWKVKIAALPDYEGEDLLDAGDSGLQTRFRYLYDFFVRHNVANAFRPFWVLDPVSPRRYYLAEIAEAEMDFEMLCATVFGAGLTIRQRRVQGVESPSDVIAAENNSEI